MAIHSLVAVDKEVKNIQYKISSFSNLSEFEVFETKKDKILLSVLLLSIKIPVQFCNFKASVISLQSNKISFTLY